MLTLVLSKLQERGTKQCRDPLGVGAQLSTAMKQRPVVDIYLWTGIVGPGQTARAWTGQVSVEIGAGTVQGRSSETGVLWDDVMPRAGGR